MCTVMFAAWIIVLAVSKGVFSTTEHTSVDRDAEVPNHKSPLEVHETTPKVTETGSETEEASSGTTSLNKEDHGKETRSEVEPSNENVKSDLNAEDTKKISEINKDQGQQINNGGNSETKERAGETKSEKQKEKKDINEDTSQSLMTSGETKNENDEEIDDDKFLDQMFFSKVNIWSDDYLKSKIKIRMVKKSWKPSGPSSETETVMESYKWDVPIAVEALETSSPYEYEEQPLKNSELLLASGKFDKNLPSIMIIHPVSANADVKFVRNTITALAMRNLHLKYNIFAVDMPELNFNMFSSTISYYMRDGANFEPIANTLASFFVEASEKGHITPDKVHLIGFSYSAQLVGYMGRYIEENTKRKIASIIALDPIGSPNNPHVRPVNKNDARVVHVYHSNSFPIGTVERRGTADFTFNDGIVQPECKGQKNPWMCSHLKLNQRFWFIILYGGAGKFKARHCLQYIKFYFGVCNDQPTAFLTYPFTEDNAKGSYFLWTSDVPPYGLGDGGCTAEKGTKERLLKYVEEKKNTDEAPYIDKELFQMMLIS